MIEVLLIRPGCTTFDEEGRIKGSLDIPLSEAGKSQAQSLANSLKTTKLDCLYVSPAESAQQSAETICEYNFCRKKTLDCLRNLDHGLWQGKLVSEVKRLQPKVYRQFQENPEGICPPEGETVQEAVARIHNAVRKLIRKHEGGRIGIMVPQPLASIVRHVLLGGHWGDLWKCELDFGTFETLRLETVPSQRELVKN
ncbi:MAG: histidine phosphatase family protein [Aureliella sp.]